MYVLGAVVSVILGNIILYPGGAKTSLKGLIYNDWLQPVFGDYPGSLLFALLFVAFNWIFGYYLYKKKIYIKL